MALDKIWRLKMKKLYSLVIVLMLVFIGISPLVAQDNSLNDVKSKGVFIMGLDDTFPPMGFRGDNGDIVGFDIDLAKEVAKRMGVELEVKPVDWSSVILSLNKGDIDVIWNGLTITETRKKQIAFSDVYLKNRLVIIVPQGSRIKKLSDLEGKKVGVQLGSSNEEALLKSPVGNKIRDVKKYDVNVSAFLDLKAKRIDAVAIDEIVARYYIKLNNEKFIVLDKEIVNENYGIGFRKNDTALLNEVNKIINEMKKDGTTARISKKWFSKDLVVK